MKVPPIFLLSSERSGTNLLRTRLTNYQDTAFGPSPVHLLKHFYNIAPYYGDLNNNDNFKSLVNDVLKLCYIHFSPWDINFYVNNIVEDLTVPRDIIKLFDYLYKKHAEEKGYATYFCKDNNLFDFAWQIYLAIPGAKFIYLYRDPRDYALSQIKRTRMTSNVIKIAQLWKTEQIKCINVLSDIRLNNEVLSIAYEDFIQDESYWLESICQFANLRKCKENTNNFNYDLGFTEEWENLSKPTLKDNYKKYQKELSKFKIDIIENICWRQMLYLGYTPENSTRPFVSVPARQAHKAVAFGKRVNKKIKSYNLEDAEIRKKRASFLRSIKQ